MTIKSEGGSGLPVLGERFEMVRLRQFTHQFESHPFIGRQTHAAAMAVKIRR